MIAPDRPTPLLHRRTLLKMVAAVGATTLPACGRHGRVAGVIPELPRHLPPVRVRPDRVIRTVVGLRPFRSLGFRVQAESIGTKTVIHNYGHGGGGVSLSWGSAQQAIELALPTGARRFAVLGAGVIGLSTARLLQDHGCTVTIYTKSLPMDSTSAIAGAQWSPTTVVERDRATPAFADQYVRASRFAHRYFQRLIGDRYGIRWAPNYYLGDTAPNPNGGWGPHLIPDLLRMGPVVEPNRSPFPGHYAQRLFTMMIEPSIYLPALLNDFRQAGGRLELRTFQTKEELEALEEPVVMNCTGLGARDLFGDPDLMPIKGQLVFLVPQPEVNYATIADRLYMFPRRDGILLGGTFERGQWSLEPDPAETERILAGHAQVFDRMK